MYIHTCPGYMSNICKYILSNGYKLIISNFLEVQWRIQYNSYFIYYAWTTDKFDKLEQNSNRVSSKSDFEMSLKNNIYALKT